MSKDKTQIIVIDPVRSYIQNHPKTGREEDDMTHSEFIDHIVPENWEETLHHYSDDEVVPLKVTKEADKKIDHMTGGRVDKGEVVAYYCLLDAVQNEQYDVVAEIIRYIPELVWTNLEVQ